VANVKKRSVAYIIIISLITFGIYFIYWLFSTGRELRELTGEEQPKVKYLIIVVILSVVAGIFRSITTTQGLSGPGIGTVLTIAIGGIATIAAIVFSIIYYWQYSKAVNKVSNGEKSAGLLMAMFIIFWPVAMGMAQSELNKHVGATPAKPATPMVKPATPTTKPAVKSTVKPAVKPATPAVTKKTPAAKTPKPSQPTPASAAPAKAPKPAQTKPLK
jgi:hypothetical protein